MAREFDDFPTYDPVIKDEKYLSNNWSDFMETFNDTLRGYLGPYGMIIPNLTTAQKNSIQSPQEGQIIYVTDANTPTLPRTAQLQIWQIVAGVGQWTMIV